MSEHEKERHLYATPEMEEIGLYYNRFKKEGCCFCKTSTGKFIPKKEHKNTKGIIYIRHKGSNYTRKNLFEHTYLKTPLKKGISSKYSPKKRKVKLSLFDRLINWFRSDEEFKTTPEMEKIGLYYKRGGEALRPHFFYKTSTGKFRPKKEHKNNKKIAYIRHKNSNYTEENLLYHIYANRPLEKGLPNKYSYRKRKAKLSLFDKLVNWFRR